MTIQGNHKQRTADTGRILCHIAGVRHQSKILDFRTGDIGLKEDISFGVWSVNPFRNLRCNHFITQFDKLFRLGVPRLDVVEFTAHTDHSQDVCFACLGAHELIEDFNTRLQNIVLACNAANIFCSKIFSLLVENDHLALLKNLGRLDNQLTPSLD